MRAHKLIFYGQLLACVLPIFLVSCSPPKPKTLTYTISNVQPRLDVKGQIVDAHGGCLQFFNGLFYLYGNALGTNKNDTFTNCPFSVYSSPNLADWKLEGTLLKDMPKGFYYRPYVVFNPKTKKYVLWYNWYKTLWKGQDGVAVSDSPTGPFTIVNQKAHLGGTSPGDGSLFVDDDGTGYYVYTDIDNHYALTIERLTPDFLDTSGERSGFIGYGIEAPVLFRRNDLYYILCSTLCASCPQGSQVGVQMANSPMGPFYNAGEINDYAPSNGVYAAGGDPSATPMELNKTNGFIRPPKRMPFIRGQETWVARLPTGNAPMFIWMADGWYSATDKTRGHDFQYWSAPLKFNDDGTLKPLKFSASWTITWYQKEQSSAN